MRKHQQNLIWRFGKVTHTMNDNTLQSKIENLIRKYKEKLNEKKRLNQKINNDIVEGIILAYEDIIEDLLKIK
jgi:hypothetical protein